MKRARLLGDIGGTHARFAWQAASAAPLGHVRTYACNDFGSIESCIARYRADEHLPAPVHVALGVATPVTGDDVRFTNSPWRFSIKALEGTLGIERCLVINDFAALAESLPALGADDLRRIGGGDAVEGTPKAVIGPGTGLGVASLVPVAPGRWRAVPGEGGHVTLAAGNDEEARWIAHLRRRHGHVSAERVLSGPGLVNLYEAICADRRATPRKLTPAQVTAEAANGADAECIAALSAFAGFLGSVAGDLALTLGARGGIYLGGGIVPALGTTFDRLPFRTRFEQKGRFAAFLREVPAWVITAAMPALLGAGRALDQALALEAG